MNYHNSTIRIKPNASRLKRSGIKRSVPGTAREAGVIYGARGGKVSRVCKHCGKLFVTWRSLPGKACSDRCARLLRRTKVSRTCKHCGVEFKIAPSQLRHYKGAGQYCSKPCANEGRINDKADKPTSDRYGRTSRQADKEWQKAVREHDNYTCQKCGKYDRHIHAHHVAPRSRRPDLKHDPKNGKCLCGSCHQWVHHHPVEAYALGLLSDATYERAQKEKLTCVLCGDKHFGLGYCGKHYRRFKKWGDPLLAGRQGHPNEPPRRVGVNA